jgi:hypothetical protein
MAGLFSPSTFTVAVSSSSAVAVTVIWPTLLLALAVYDGRWPCTT